MPAKRFGAAVLIALLAAPVFGESEETRRTDVGIRMFGTVLGADVDLAKKTDNGKLLLIIYYTSDRDRAEELARALRSTPAGEPRTISGVPVEVETTSDASLKSYVARTAAGIFLAQSPEWHNLRSIVQYGIAHHFIVYSPFDGHVESGVLGGLSIGAQVKPYVNLTTVQASQITLKPLFMKVTKVFQ